MCQRAGITVHYCADEFENDGSLASFMLKNNKRFNAADFSRQLSKKVFLGQSRITRMGFWRGGMPGYGLRRQLRDEAGAVRTMLERSVPRAGRRLGFSQPAMGHALTISWRGTATRGPATFSVDGLRRCSIRNGTTIHCEQQADLSTYDAIGSSHG
jgi:hypothetical protein